MGLVKLFRRECTDCGNSGLQWMTGDEADWSQLVDVLPPEDIDLADLIVWQCRRCGQTGCMFPYLDE